MLLSGYQILGVLFWPLAVLAVIFLGCTIEIRRRRFSADATEKRPPKLPQWLDQSGALLLNDDATEKPPPDLPQPSSEIPNAPKFDPEAELDSRD